MKEGAPHLSNDNWPNLTDPSFVAQVYQYYGKQPYPQPSGGLPSPAGKSTGTNP
jgi:hypothetical protein